MKIILLSFGLLLSLSAFSQSNYTQTIRGTVEDIDMHFELTGATIILKKDSTIITGTKSDSNGNFVFKDVPIGKYSITSSYLGYKKKSKNNIEVTSGREVQVEILMTPSARSLKEVKIKQERGRVNQEMATVSARSFNPEEASRYTASREDIARMATNFAGVRGSDDSRNDIVIRGNTPNGIIWRIEDMDVPNPNHFATFGSSGGPVNIVNNKLLRNSDFMTSAFPSDYGNGISGVFDLKMRNGNRKKHELAAQIGILGLEAMAEGPLNDKGASYIAAYRYSTLTLMNALGINFGTSGTPAYHDLNFKVHIPLKKGMQINFFGIGGISDIEILANGEDSTTWTFGRAGRDIHYGSRFGLFGANFQQILNKSTYQKLTIAYNANRAYSRYDTISPDNISRGPTYRNKFSVDKIMLHYYINKRFSPKHTLKTGLMISHFMFDMTDSNYYAKENRWFNEAKANGSTQLLQAYSTYKFTPSDKMQLTAGLHYLDFRINKNSQVLEPRFGMSYQINDKLRWSAGYGLHSKINTLYIYWLQKEDQGGYPYYYNKDVGLIRSHHAATGIDYTPKKGMRIKAEVYYQYLFNIPTEDSGSAYSPLNNGATFNFIFPDNLSNTGVGFNYGIDLTLEKYFVKNFYYLVTGSLYTSKYKASDGVWRNTEFNGGYNLNVLSGKEWDIGKKKNTRLISGFKFNYAGGKWYTPIDLARSAEKNQYEGIDAERNTLQFQAYNRLDVRLGIKVNRPRVHHHFYIDLLNVYNQKNPLALSYIPNTQEVITESNLGFLPLFNWLMEF